MKFINEFKSFAIKGNMVDMSVGIIIGGAFGQIVNSLVKDIIMPPLGLLTGGVDFSDKVWVMKKATDTAAAVTMNYGMFLNVLVNFVIVSFAIFVVIKQMNRIRQELEKENTPEAEEAPKEDKHVTLLTEIRDLIKETRI